MNTALRGLYVITDPALTPPERILDQVAAALQGGVRLVQFRDKHSPAHIRTQQAKALLTLCRAHHARLLINDDVELCRQLGADGVHLGRSDTRIIEARKRLGPEYLIGATCHNSVAYAQEAIQQSANYVAFGRFFPSHTKPDAPPVRLSELQAALPSLSVPAAAIGGITLDRTPPLVAAGFAMVAVIHDVFSRDTHAITAHCQRYTDLLTPAQP